MNDDWPSANRSLAKLIADYRKDAPEVAASFSGLAKAQSSFIEHVLGGSALIYLNSQPPPRPEPSLLA